MGCFGEKGVKEGPIVFPMEEELERGFLELRLPKKPWGYRWESRPAALLRHHLYITKPGNPHHGFVINLANLHAFTVHRHHAEEGDPQRKTTFGLTVAKGIKICLRVTCREEERFWLPLLSLSQDSARYVWRKNSARSTQPESSVQGLVYGPSHLVLPHIPTSGSQLSIHSTIGTPSGTEVASTVSLLLGRLSSRDRELAEQASENGSILMELEKGKKESWDLTQLSSDAFNLSLTDPNHHPLPTDALTTYTDTQLEEGDPTLISFTSTESIPIISELSIIPNESLIEELSVEELSEESTLKESLVHKVFPSTTTEPQPPESTCTAQTEASEEGEDSGMHSGRTCASHITSPTEETRKVEAVHRKEQQNHTAKPSHLGTYGTGQFMRNEATTKQAPPPAPPIPGNFQLRLWAYQPFQSLSKVRESEGYDPAMVKCGLCRKMHVRGGESEERSGCSATLMEELTAAVNKRRHVLSSTSLSSSSP